jgi:CMP-2-keto-3-deoxyoctulosonic acid synthetase
MIRADQVRDKYPKGVKVSDAEMTALNLSRHDIPWRLELHDLTSHQSLCKNTNC